VKPFKIADVSRDKRVLNEPISEILYHSIAIDESYNSFFTQ